MASATDRKHCLLPLSLCYYPCDFSHSAPGVAFFYLYYTSAVTLFLILFFPRYAASLTRGGIVTIKINRRDDAFAKLVAEAREAPGFSYAKSRNRDYKGFNDDFQAEKLLKNDDIQQAVSVYKKHIIAADIVGRQEALIDLSARFRAPDSTAVMLELQALEKMRLEPEVFRSRMAAIDTRAVKNIKRTKHGWQVEGLDKSHLAARILTLAGVDISKPITDEGKRLARETLTEIYRDMGFDDGD
ncbi:TPA: hypothetical protein ACGQ2V_003936 [Klebsiella michiganensis]